MLPSGSHVAVATMPLARPMPTGVGDKTHAPYHPPRELASGESSASAKPVPHRLRGRLAPSQSASSPRSPGTRSSVGSASVSRVLRRSTLAGSPRAPTSLTRGDRRCARVPPVRDRRTPASQPRNGEHHGPSNPHRPLERPSSAGLRSARRARQTGDVRSAAVQQAASPQGRRAARQVVPRLSRQARALLQASEGGLDCRRRLPAMRLPQKTRRRLPLPAVPRRPRRRARAEAPGRHRRGSGRRVRRQARQGARALESRLRSQPMERPCAAGTVGSLLVAAARPGAEGGARLGSLHTRRWKKVPSLLIHLSAGACGPPRSRAPARRPGGFRPPDRLARSQSWNGPSPLRSSPGPPGRSASARP